MRTLRLALILAVVVSGCDAAAFERGASPDALEGADASALAASAAGTPAPRPHALDERPEAPTVGMDSTLLAAALERAAGLERLHNMIVARHGEVVAARHFRGPGLSQAANVKSASKSILSALVGIAVAEGHLEGVGQPAIPFFEAELTDEQAAERAGITVGHLLAMRSGLASTSGRNYGAWVTSGDWVRHAIRRPVEAAPGEAMIYSTGSTHLLSAILTRATGESTHAYARSRLAEPLGFQLPPWPRGPEGVYFGGNDMLVSPRALLRFGELYRNGGALDGRQIVPETWVRASWDTRDRTDSGRRAPNRHEYGLGWWGRDSNGLQVRFAWGYGGQFVFVVPALELTVVFTSDPWSPREGPHNNALHRMLDELLVPAAVAGGGSAATRGATPAG